MQAIENKIISRIYGRGRGWAFSKTDFIVEFGEVNIHKALSTLENRGRIRRVMRGIYDYPSYSELLQQPLSPDLDQVAHALARKFNWSICPAGQAALNLLGLSTQVPASWVYLSNGPDREYQLGKHKLVFKRTALKELDFSRPESGVLVQAIKALGDRQLDNRTLETLRQHWDKATKARILQDTRTVSSWIYNQIKEICQGPVN